MLAKPSLPQILGVFNSGVGLVLLAVSLHILYLYRPGDIMLGVIFAALASAFIIFGLFFGFGRRWAQKGLLLTHTVILLSIAKLAYAEYRVPTDPEIVFPLISVVALVAGLNIALLLNSNACIGLQATNESKRKNG